MEINNRIAFYRNRYARRIRSHSIIVVIVCIILALYGQELIRFFLRPFTTLMCSRQAWLVDYLFSLNGGLVVWQFNNC